MIRDITIGQYYPSDSPIHHLDPRVKLFATLLYIIGLFLSKSLIVFAVAGVVLIACIVISKVPFRYMIKGLKPVWILLVFICIVNVFFGKGEVLYFQWKFIHIYREGIMQAVVRVVRLMELILGSSLMTYTTTPTELTDGLEKAFHPLTKIHVPVHEIALMMSITLRFIPILIDGTRRGFRGRKCVPEVETYRTDSDATFCICSWTGGRSGTCDGSTLLSGWQTENEDVSASICTCGWRRVCAGNRISGRDDRVEGNGWII